MQPALPPNPSPAKRLLPTSGLSSRETGALFASLILMAHAAVALAADNACTFGELRTDATPYCISIEWDVGGDANHNAACAVEFRKPGSTWQKAMPLMRVDFRWWYNEDKAEQPMNLFAGSILFLEPGTKYEVKLTAKDADGGAAEKLVTVATRAEPRLPAGGRTLYISPGKGGGKGTAAEPFRGLKEAQAAARAGDIMLLKRGSYGSFEFTRPGEPGKYLVWKSEEPQAAQFDTVRVLTDHLWFEGLKLQKKEGDTSNGLKAQGKPADVVVSRCDFSGFHYSITLTPESRYWHIVDNAIVGDNDPDLPDKEGGLSGEGVELNHSSGHVVAHNRISRVADGVSYCDRNCDIFGNDIFDASDDGLEPDYGFANNRMWGNRITNAKNHALSFQPMKCGPWYFIRNLCIGGRNTFKFRVQDRFVLVNNTFVSWGPSSDYMHHILRSLSRNNLYILAGPSRPIWTAHNARQPKFCLPDEFDRNWMTDVDYDGFDWGDSSDGFRWYGGQKWYKDVTAFAAAVGIEQHGRRVRKEEIFEKWTLPEKPMRVEPLGLPLKAGCNAIDAGDALPNLTDGFTGKAPDLGAYEHGRPLPHYGPRK